MKAFQVEKDLKYSVVGRQTIAMRVGYKNFNKENLTEFL